MYTKYQQSVIMSDDILSQPEDKRLSFYNKMIDYMLDNFEYTPHTDEDVAILRTVLKNYQAYKKIFVESLLSTPMIYSENVWPIILFKITITNYSPNSHSKSQNKFISRYSKLINESIKY